MADLNILADIAPAEQAPAVAPPTKMDDQILPSSKWVPIDKNILKDALGITPTNDNTPFEAPHSSDTVIEYVKTLGYPRMLKNVSAMSVNALYQSWRAIMSMINMCLTSKTTGFNRLRHPVLQEELSHESSRKEKDPSSANSKCFVGKDGREVFGMPIPDALLTDEITSAPYYSRYLEHVAEYQRCLDKEHGKAEEEDVIESPKAAKATKSKTAKQTKLSAPKASKLVDEFVNEGVPEQEPVYGVEEADIQREREKRSVRRESDEEVSPEINAGTQDEGQA
ncbi:hypothetical protein Tco_0899091 [Tanacetum coccineum]